MKLAVLSALAAVLCATSAHAQYQGRYSNNPYAQDRVNPYQSGGSLYANDGQYLGNANSNQFDPNSTSNQFGRYGSEFSPDSVNNPYGKYGSPFSSDSPNNPYGQGVAVCGPLGCD